MDAINKAIKLNIQNHFERWCRECKPDCSDCPFDEECSDMVDDRCRCLCEIITGKSQSQMSRKDDDDENKIQS